MKEYPNLESVRAQRLTIVEIIQNQTKGERKLSRKVLGTIIREARKNDNSVFALLYLVEALQYAHGFEQKRKLHDVIVWRISCCKRELHVPLLQHFITIQPPLIVEAACKAVMYSWSLKDQAVASISWCKDGHKKNREIAAECIRILDSSGLGHYFKVYPNQFDTHPKKQKQKRRKSRNLRRRRLFGGMTLGFA